MLLTDRYLVVTLDLLNWLLVAAFLGCIVLFFYLLGRGHGARNPPE